MIPTSNKTEHQGQARDVWRCGTVAGCFKLSSLPPRAPDLEDTQSSPLEHLKAHAGSCLFDERVRVWPGETRASLRSGSRRELRPVGKGGGDGVLVALPCARSLLRLQLPLLDSPAAQSRGVGKSSVRMRNVA